MDTNPVGASASWTLDLGLDDSNGVEGLIYVPGFLDEATEASLVRWLDAQPWMDDLSRRVQHYGWRYDYRARRVDPHQRLGALPGALADLAERLVGEGVLSALPDQAIVNEYLPGQGIAAHVDCEPCFGDEIATVSLLSGVPMIFRHLKTGVVVERWLERRSACVLAGESRYEWTHEIPKRRSDPVAGARQNRTRRVSLTFRRVVV